MKDCKYLLGMGSQKNYFYEFPSYMLNISISKSIVIWILKLSGAMTSLDSLLLLLHLLDLPHDDRHLALLSRQIQVASLAIPPQLFVPLPLSLP
jgi:hypothetical protein